MADTREVTPPLLGHELGAPYQRLEAVDLTSADWTPSTQHMPRGIVVASGADGGLTMLMSAEDALDAKKVGPIPVFAGPNPYSVRKLYSSGTDASLKGVNKLWVGY